MCAQIFFAPSKIAIFEYHLNPIYDINSYSPSKVFLQNDGSERVEFVYKNKLSFNVEIVDECEEVFDDGLVIFKFTSAEFSDITAFSGNNPGVIYKADRGSKEHTHDYDEYMLCVEGEYIVTIDGKEYVLHAGDELFIPKGSLQGGRVKAGTRSIHAFGGQRMKG